ncbi:hypothetical protein GW17_00046232 [Ensete ventricosum]|nr:hypothetical protein GW17_00046232 [Ensete ventricosum]
MPPLPTLRQEAAPRLPVLGLGDASSTRWKMRRRLVFSFAGIRRCLVLLLEGEVGTRRRLIFLRCDEASPRSPAGRQGVTSSSCVGTRRYLIFLLEGEATPRLRALGRGAASFFCWKARQCSSSNTGTRRCLVLLLEGEAAPPLPALGRGAASFFLGWDETLPLFFVF